MFPLIQIHVMLFSSQLSSILHKLFGNSPYGNSVSCKITATNNYLALLGYKNIPNIYLVFGKNQDDKYELRLVRSVLFIAQTEKFI